MKGINPFIFLKDVLPRNGSHPINQIELLLPQNWMAGVIARGIQSIHKLKLSIALQYNLFLLQILRFIQ
jgi:hypothetical protein